jgi:hypothetical protein
MQERVMWLSKGENVLINLEYVYKIFRFINDGSNDVKGRHFAIRFIFANGMSEDAYYDSEKARDEAYEYLYKELMGSSKKE